MGAWGHLVRRCGATFPWEGKALGISGGWVVAKWIKKTGKGGLSARLETISAALERQIARGDEGILVGIRRGAAWW